MVDQFPAEDSRLIRALQRRVDALETLVKRNPAVPVTGSTGGNGFRVVGSPATPLSGVQIGLSGGQIVFTHSNGSQETIPSLAPAAAVANPPVFTSPSNPGATVTVAAYQALRDDCQAGLRASDIALRNSLRDAGYLAP